MTIVSGYIKTITGEPSNTLSVSVRADRTRPSASGVTTAEPQIVSWDPATGELIFTAEPGAAVITLSMGSRMESIPISVPESATATLEEVVSERFEYTPQVVSESVATIRGAVDKAIAPYVIQVGHEKELAQDAAATSIAHAVMAGDAAQGAYVSKDLSQDAAAVSVTHAVLAGEVISDALLDAHDDVIRIAVDGTEEIAGAIMTPYVEAARREKELAQDAGAVVATGLALMQDLVNQMKTP